ncbi:SUMF1/EgtB/PvdO family nonheme iron enzyme [Pontiellaceae bacterium B1224]|nr:SUMF1/EgtB/PvdO family nonheme iron enzyme [Pontiellaceae bacterium B1224]
MNRFLKFQFFAAILVAAPLLMSGDATAAKEKRNKDHADAEQVFPVSKVIEDARLAIEFLGKKHQSYKAKDYLKKLTALETAGAPFEKIDELRYEALVLNNPEVDFDKILFRSSQSDRFPSNWQGNSTLLRRGGKESKPRFGDEFRVLDLNSKAIKTLYRPTEEREALMDICLDYSGGKFLYSGIDLDSNTFQVYEMNLAGGRPRRITPILPEIDNYNGIYLPNGKILFCSTASLNSVPCVGGSDYVGTLYEIDADGRNMKQVCFDQENDWYPWVKETGRVMYSRWEYTDNSHYFTRILLEMNPDGTGNRSIYGSNSYWPNTLFYAKQIPGHTSKFSAIVSGHHGTARAGELIIFDQSKGDFEANGALQRIPGRGEKVEPVIIDNYMKGKWPRFLHPYPLSENFFLVSGQMRDKGPWALYLVDTFDNMVQLGESEDYMFEPVPIKVRKVPPVIPDRRRPDAKNGMLYIQDIYEGPGLEGLPRDTVAGLRLFTYGYAYRLSGSHDALAIEGAWDTKRILGTVPIEEDGSVMVTVPHSRPISIQPIDKDGRALQVMRSWTVAQQGEVVSCVGCHEPSNTSPLSRPALASRKAPQNLRPWTQEEMPYGFGFKREVQPVLDRYCVGCHNGSTPDRPDFKDISEVQFGRKTRFGKSYMALHPYVRRPGPESNLHMLNPMEYHTSTSPLFQILEKGHYGVEVDAASMRKLIEWVDLNVPYHASWTEVNDSEATQEIAELTVQYKKIFSGINDNIEWLPPLPKRPNFEKPARVPKPPTPLTLTGWPLGNRAAPERRTLSFGGQSLDFVKIPAGKYVMGSVTGAPDEYPQTVVEIKKPFLMSTTEITNEQLQQFLPDHDSQFIDQQWKDHIYAGYPANEPEMPAVRVSWNDALAFTQQLSEKVGRRVTLPTEAQWEWAARAGSDQPFFFGDSGFEKYANLADRSIGLLAVRGVNPKPVAERSRTPLNNFVPRDESFDDGQMVPSGTAQYAPNPWGLYDMHGNVAEWTRTSYEPYPYSETDGRNDLSLGDRKTVRGGSWRDRPKRATSSCRLMYAPFQKVYNVGFRVVLEYASEAELDADFSSWKMASGKRAPTAGKSRKPRMPEQGGSLASATITASRPMDGREGLWMLIDGDHYTKWYDSGFEASMWIQIQLEGGAKETCSSYTMVSGNDVPGRDPKGWELHGSKDNGKSWTLLDKRSNEIFKDRLEVREFPIAAPAPYNAYKLVITDCTKGVQLSEIELNFE